MGEPIRCFEGNAKPHEPFWRFRNAVEGEEPEMELYGYISEYSWFDDDVTPKMFKDDLQKHGKGGPVTVRINSAGGDVMAAAAMKAALLDYPGRVTVKIDGLAASAATIVAMAGDRVKIHESAYMMVHDPAVVVMMAWLDIGTLGGMLDMMKSIKSGIVDAYETRTGLSRERLTRMMSAETWLTAREAVNLGFADELVAEKAQAKAPATAAVVNALRNYRNVPEDLLTARCACAQVPAEDAEGAEDLQEVEEEGTTRAEPDAGDDGLDAEAIARLRAEVKLLV